MLLPDYWCRASIAWRGWQFAYLSLHCATQGRAAGIFSVVTTLLIDKTSSREGRASSVPSKGHANHRSGSYYLTMGFSRA